MTAQESHTPPLGFAALTPFYDRAIAGLTREKAWRGALVRNLCPQPGETILDVGSGTGSLAVTVTAVQPRCFYRGIDPDSEAVEIARRKAAKAGSSATFEVGRFGPAAPDEIERLDAIVCSLVLHQVPLPEKRRLIQAMFDRLKPGGRLFVADYGRQSGLVMRIAFRLTVQLLDGRADTQPNADGILPLFIAEAGFDRLASVETFDTPTGQIEILRAFKPGLRESAHEDR